MNGFGIGLTVALGIATGFALSSPGVEPQETLLTVLFWSFMAGLLYELYRIAFAPIRRR